jgi:ElaB/YqjD/DUF883 family membrane-anchored ribosome-binding protein
MATDTFELATEEAQTAGKSATDAVDHGRQALNEAIVAAEKVFVEGAKRADHLFRESERSLKENLERFREQAKVYGESASQSVDEAQRYVVDRVKERPVTATLAGLGLGVVLGLILSGRHK